MALFWFRADAGAFGSPSRLAGTEVDAPKLLHSDLHLTAAFGRGRTAGNDGLNYETVF